MNSTELVRFPTRASRTFPGPRAKSPPFYLELIAPVRHAIVRARRWLIAEQKHDGSWSGRQPTDASLASQLIFLLTCLGREDSELAQQCATSITNDQNDDGGWSLAPGGQVDVCISVQAYLALKLAGYDPCDERLARARETIRGLGGLGAVDDTMRYFLALFGQISYADCSPAPPEFVRFHDETPQRRIPLSVLWSHRPIHDAGIERGVRELFLENPCDWPTTGGRRGFRRLIGCVCRNMFDFFERHGWTPLRRRGLARAESVLLKQISQERISELDFPELVWHTIALHTLGYDADSSEMLACQERIYELIDIDDELGTATPRLRENPLSDTSLAIQSLIASGVSPGHSAIETAIESLHGAMANPDSVGTLDLCRCLETLHSLDASVVDDDSTLPPDFELYDDWREPLGESQGPAGETDEAFNQMAARAAEHIGHRQNSDGGWGHVFSVSRRKRAGEPDITGQVLTAIRNHVDLRYAANRAADYLRRQQRADGSWTNSDGANSTVCTSHAIRGLVAAGATPEEDGLAAALNWIAVHQQPNGCWDGVVSNTAQALIALVAAGESNHPAARRGIDFLLDAQDDDGAWPGSHLAATDDFSCCHFQNDLHGSAWPLLAMSQWAVAISSSHSEAAHQVSLRLVADTAPI